MQKYIYDMSVTYHRKCDVLAGSAKEADEKVENMWEDHIADFVPDRLGDGTFDLKYDNHKIDYNYETGIGEEKEDTGKESETVKEDSMRKYTYMVKAVYEGNVSVEAESEAKAENMVDDIYHSKIIDALPDWFACGDYKLLFADGEITLEGSVPVEQKKDTDVKEVNVLSPQNVFGMITAINESYRKLYTEGK